MTKQQLRKQYRERREQLGQPQKERMLAAMQHFFGKVPIGPGSVIMSYMPMLSRGEVDAGIFEKQLLESGSHLRFCYPSVRFDTGEMEAIFNDENTRWEDAAFGLRQPAGGTIANPVQVDVVIAPLLAFDRKGNRLGYGKGFYDRFLSRCRPDVVSIGLSWFEAEQSLPEIGHHDVPLKYCVTPQCLYVF